MSVTAYVWSVGEVVTASNMNTIKDDITYLSTQGIGEESIYLDAATLLAQTGSEPGALEVLDNGDTVHYGIPFGDSADEIMNFKIGMPKRYDQGTIYAKFYWTTGSGGSAGDALWGVASKILDDGDALGSALTFNTVTDAWQADMDNHESDWIENSSQAGSATGDNPLLEIALGRIGSNVSDSLSGDAHLLGVLIRWTSDQETDD